MHTQSLQGGGPLSGTRAAGLSSTHSADHVGGAAMPTPPLSPTCLQPLTAIPVTVTVTLTAQDSGALRSSQTLGLLDTAGRKGSGWPNRAHGHR